MQYIITANGIKMEQEAHDNYLASLVTENGKYAFGKY